MATDGPRHRFPHATRRRGNAFDAGDITVADEAFLAAIDPDGFDRQSVNGTGDGEIPQLGRTVSDAPALERVGTFADAPPDSNVDDETFAPEPVGAPRDAVDVPAIRPTSRCPTSSIPDPVGGVRSESTA